MFIRGAVALVILIVAYWGWALAGAAQLASAAQRGDAEAVMERVDLQALIVHGARLGIKGVQVILYGFIENFA